MNEFEVWCKLKTKVDSKEKIIGFKERNIAFIHMGRNIGMEQNGKGDLFLRPVIVVKRLNRRLFFGIPMTSKEKSGSFFLPIAYTHKGREYKSTAILAQAKVFDAARIRYLKGMIRIEDFKQLKKRFEELTLAEAGEPRRELQKRVYLKSEEKSIFVHPSSYVDAETNIGTDTKIWHFCHILSETTIGNNCSFGQNCVVGPKVTIGNGVKVQNNVSIYEGVEIEDEVFLGPSMVFTNVINPRAFIQRKDEFRKTLLKRGCSVGANATIVCGVTIGEYALIGSGAVVTKDVPPFALMVGVPARQIGWVGVSGNTLSFNEEGVAIDLDGKRYAMIEGKMEVL